MGRKDVDLHQELPCEQLPDHIPYLSSESQYAKNDWGVITRKKKQELITSEANEAYVDPQEAVINVHSLAKKEESSGNVYSEINPSFPCNPSQVSGLDEIKVASVENDNESSFKSVYDAGGQRGIKDVPEIFAQTLVASKPVQQEQKSQLKETTLSSDVQKWCWTNFTWIVILLFSFTFCRVDGTGDIYPGIVFPPSIELICQVPQSSQSTWLRGRTTIQKNGVKEGNISLRISDQEIKDYDCEIKLPTGNKTLLQFPLKAFSSCALAENDDLSAFKEGKKSVEVELNGKANELNGKADVTKCYLLRMQNQTLQIYFEQGTDVKLQLDHVQCKVTFKEIDMVTAKYSGNEGTNVEVGGKEKSSEIGKTLGMVFVAGVFALVLCLVFWFMVKRWKSSAPRIQDEEAGAGCIQDGEEEQLGFRMEKQEHLP